MPCGRAFGPNGANPVRVVARSPARPSRGRRLSRPVRVPRSQDEALVRAYTACILANIAFLEPGQTEVLRVGGVPPLIKLLKAKDDKKVTLHSTAAIQNLTYKNTHCCQAVLQQGGEKALNKLPDYLADEGHVLPKCTPSSA